MKIHTKKIIAREFLILAGLVIVSLIIEGIIVSDFAVKLGFEEYDFFDNGISQINEHFSKYGDTEFDWILTFRSHFITVTRDFFTFIILYIVYFIRAIIWSIRTLKNKTT